MKNSTWPRLIVAALLVLMSPVLAHGQVNVGGYFTIALPQGEFDENVENNGYGLTGQALFSVPGSPVAIGASFGGAIYGSETRREPFSLTIPEVTVEVKTHNYILPGHLVMKRSCTPCSSGMIMIV